MEILREIVEQSTDLDFLESVNLVKSHCKLQKNSIEYLIEIPVYNSKESKLFQITSIPIFHNNSLYILDEIEELIVKIGNKFVMTEKCIRIKNKYFCQTNRFKAQTCVTNIIEAHNDTKCMYHEIFNSLIIQKIKNSDIVIVASSKNVTIKIICNDYDKTKFIMGVFKLKTEKNSSINNQLLKLTKYYNKKLIFEDVNINLSKNQLTNKIMNFKQINEIDMIMKELRNIDDIEIDKTESHFMVYITIAITAITISAIIFRKEIVSKIASIKQRLTLGELRNHQAATSAEIQGDRGRRLESAIAR